MCVDNKCVEDPTGEHASLEACQAVCNFPKKGWSCIGNECKEVEGGDFSTKGECDIACLKYMEIYAPVKLGGLMSTYRDPTNPDTTPAYIVTMARVVIDAQNGELLVFFDDITKIDTENVELHESIKSTMGVLEKWTDHSNTPEAWTPDGKLVIPKGQSLVVRQTKSPNYKLELYRQEGENLTVKGLRDMDPRRLLGKNNKIKVGDNQTWQLNPESVHVNKVNAELAAKAKLAKVDKTHGFKEGNTIININFGKYTTNRRTDNGKGRFQIENNPPPPIRIAVQALTKYKDKDGHEFPIPGNLPPKTIAGLIRKALNIQEIPKPQGGGAISSIHHTINDLPFILQLQSLWEQSQTHYRNLEPRYQQMLPEPDSPPIEELQDSFHRYMDMYGEQDMLEEARSTVGIMRPEEAEDLFHNDRPEINAMYQEALPDIDKDIIPIFVRADLLRMLLSRR